MFMFTKRSLPLLLVMLLCTLNATASRGTKNWYFGSFSSNVISNLGNGAAAYPGSSNNFYYTFSDLTDVSFDADSLRDLKLPRELAACVSTWVLAPKASCYYRIAGSRCRYARANRSSLH